MRKLKEFFANLFSGECAIEPVSVKKKDKKPVEPVVVDDQLVQQAVDSEEQHNL